MKDNVTEPPDVLKQTLTAIGGVLLFVMLLPFWVLIGLMLLIPLYLDFMTRAIFGDD